MQLDNYLKSILGEVQVPDFTIDEDPWYSFGCWLSDYGHTYTLTLEPPKGLSLAFGPNRSRICTAHLFDGKFHDFGPDHLVDVEGFIQVIPLKEA